MTIEGMKEKARSGKNLKKKKTLVNIFKKLKKTVKMKHEMVGYKKNSWN